MAFNGSGTFVRVYNWVTDRLNSVPITDTRMDGEFDGIATGLSNTITRDGQSAATARIPFAQGISLGNGLVGSPALNFASDADTGFYSIGTDRIGMAVAGVQAMDIPSAGWVAAAPVFAFEGDSMSAPAGVGTWPTKLKALSTFFSRGTSYYYATAGDTAASMVAQYATEAGALPINTKNENYYFLWAGTNDLIVSTTGATVYGYLTTMWAAARASGYKVVAFCVPRRGDLSSAQNDQRIALNVLIQSDPTLYDYLIRPDLLLTNTADTSLFIDTLHLTDAGNTVVAKAVAAKLLGTAPALPLDALGYFGLQINGGMEVNTENGTTATATLTGAYATDGAAIAIAGTAAVTAQRVSDAPIGHNNSLKITVTTAQAVLGTTDNVRLRIPIEGYRSSRLSFGTVNAQPITLGFWTKIHRIGQYGGALGNGAGGRCYPFSFTQSVSDIWEYKTITIPGDVTGTWVGNTSGIGLSLSITLAAGTLACGTANVWDASNNLSATGQINGVAALTDVFQITGLCILPGIEVPNASQSSRILRPYPEELALCERYFQRLGGSAALDIAFRGYSTNNLGLHTLSYTQTMRAVPTVTEVGAWLKTNVTSANYYPGTQSTGVELVITAPGDYAFYITGGGTYLNLSARL